MSKIRSPKYRNASNNVAALKQAYLEVIATKNSLDNITVSEIVKRAGLNRGTFYNHFESIHALQKAIEEDAVRYVSDVIEHARIEQNPGPIVDSLTELVSDHGRLIKKVIALAPFSLYEGARKKLFSRLEEDGLNRLNLSSKNILLLSMISSGIASTYLDWINGNIQMDVADLGEALKEILNRIIAAFSDEP